MRGIFLIITALMIQIGLNAQKEAGSIYKPEAYAKEDLAKAMKQAKKENKHVILQIGGNWCPWCIKLHKLLTTDSKIDSLMKADYIYVLVNYSKDNKNTEILKELGYPQRFGFPVLVVLDRNGKRIHTQDSGLLELEKGYDKKKVMVFLKGWTAGAINNEKRVN